MQQEEKDCSTEQPSTLSRHTDAGQVEKEENPASGRVLQEAETRRSKRM